MLVGRSFGCRVGRRTVSLGIVAVTLTIIGCAKCWPVGDPGSVAECRGEPWACIGSAPAAMA